MRWLCFQEMLPHLCVVRPPVARHNMCCNKHQCCAVRKHQCCKGPCSCYWVELGLPLCPLFEIPKLFLQFHLQKGYHTSGTQAAKILNNTKATLVCKDNAQALWTNEVLATRSISGKSAPTKWATGMLPKKQLAPQNWTLFWVSLHKLLMLSAK